MGPIVKECETDFADKSITFVTFDFTTDETTKAAAAKAAELGITELYKANEGKTGKLMLYDTQSKKVVETLSARNDKAAWVTAIDKGLGGA